MEPAIVRPGHLVGPIVVVGVVNVQQSIPVDSFPVS